MVGEDAVQLPQFKGPTNLDLVAAGTLEQVLGGRLHVDLKPCCVAVPFLVLVLGLPYNRIYHVHPGQLVLRLALRFRMSDSQKNTVL